MMTTVGSGEGLALVLVWVWVGARENLKKTLAQVVQYDGFGDMPDGNLQ